METKDRLVRRMWRPIPRHAGHRSWSFLNRHGWHGSSQPTPINEAGFFEDYFGGKDEALSKSWHLINKLLSEAG